jgi:3-hydroxy-D-aspartate aldolase
MDADYVGLSCADGRTLGETFAPALFVVTSVISTPAHDRAVVDAGLKALAFDSGPPQVLEPGNLVYRNASDEHGVVTAPHDVELPGLSSRLWLVPGHCDPTVALHAQMYAVKEGRIAAIWPVIGRGEW